MTSVLQQQLRTLPRTIRRTTRKTTTRGPAASRRSFHRCARLRAADTPKDIAGASNSNAVAGSRKTDTSREIARVESAPLPKATPAPETHREEPSSPNEGSDGTQPPIYHGSMLRRRQQALSFKKAIKPRAVPSWFSNHNVHLREHIDATSLPTFIAVDNDPQTGYPSLGPSSDQRFEESKDRLSLRTTPEESSHGDDQNPNQNITSAQKLSLEPETKHGLAQGAARLEKYLDERLKQNFGGSDSKRGISTPKQYLIDRHQQHEITLTARGLVRLHPESATSPSELAIQKAHLLLYCPARGGDYFLDGLVQDMSKDLQCDLISLDAQDISELISNEALGNEITADGRLLSYEVYCEDEEDSYAFSASSDPAPDEEQEDEGPEDSERVPEHPFGRSFGTPIIVGKPITLQLSDFSKMPGSMSGPPRPLLSDAIKKLFGDKQEKSKPKFRSHLFAPLVDRILSSPRRKREASSHSASPEGTNDGFIIHIRELKAIQDTAIGSQFLGELYEQVQSRRAARQPVMIVGTECAAGSPSEHSRERLQDIQKHEMDEISRTIVVTPVQPDTKTRRSFLEDRRRRIAAINLRHLWTMLSQKTELSFYSLKPGFWMGDFTKNISKDDFLCLRDDVFTFGHIHRIATVIVGMERSTVHPEKDQSIIQSALASINRSDQSKWDWADSSRSPRISGLVSGELMPMPGMAAHGMPVPITKPENSRLAAIRATASKYEKRLLGGVIEPDKIRTTFNDVHAPIETIDALQTLTTLSLIRPEAFKYGVLASDRIPGLLLYGPPGTGKTLLAKAVAKESGATVLEASAADINDMYVGEGEKNVQALFKLAKKLSPCVVFLDEADAMFSARGASGKRVNHRELLNQFLREWDGMSNDSGSAFLMVATNRPMDLDDAVLRRLPRRLLVDLPTEADRLAILKIHLRNEQVGDDVSLVDLAAKTPFYSGSDLKNVAVAAALNCVREENQLAKEHQGEEPYQHAEQRTLRRNHFERALEEISASISEDMSSLKEIKKFDEQYGDKRGRKKKGGSFGFRNPAEADKVLDTVKVRA